MEELARLLSAMAEIVKAKDSEGKAELEKLRESWMKSFLPNAVESPRNDETR